jgi:C-terminal processing protease CtpA/Prc
MWQQVDREGIRTLIVDMRLNGGGNFITGRRHMVDPARQRLERGTLRQVIVLIGNSTFSAAMVNAIDFRKRCHAVLAGEPIGERPNSYSERRVTRLPQSKILVTYSVRWYAFQNESDPPTVMPDALVAPTYDEWRTAHDPVLEWALAHRAR